MGLLLFLYISLAFVVFVLINLLNRTMFLEYSSMMEYSSMNIHLVYEFAFVILLYMFDDEICK